MKNRLFRFAVVGLSATVADLFVYASLVHFFDLSIGLAKGIGFVTGTFLGFVLNRGWTFSSNSKPTAKFFQYSVLYAFSLCVNVAINTGVINTLGKSFIASAVAFSVATIVTATLNFMVLQGVIFAKRK